MIEPQLPMLSAFCTLSVLIPADSLMRTNQVPTIENKIPTPAISIGNTMGENPPMKSSPITIVSCPNTIVARTVAT